MVLPPNNLGDLLATDLRDMLQSNYSGITAGQIQFEPKVQYKPTTRDRRACGPPSFL
ncbi:MAG TPA: hypothetical protein VMI10_08110 [Terriglobales bacterium]|nr:hypothetical protein [Terriglobales bacterium]